MTACFAERLMDRRKPDLAARNQLIKQLRDSGLSYFKIGRKVGLSHSQVAQILHAMTAETRYPPLPSEVSLKTAILFQKAFGHWPTDDTAALIAALKDDWILAPGVRLKNIAEIATWLERVLA